MTPLLCFADAKSHLIEDMDIGTTINGGSRKLLVGIPTSQKKNSQSKQKHKQTPIIFTKLRKAQTKAYIGYIFSWTVISVEL
jgi:hypothetical protein